MTEQRRAVTRRVSDVVGRINRPLYRKQGFGEPRVLTEWATIVGPGLAAHSCPERLSAAGVLRVRVSGPAALELNHLEPLVLERLATYFGFRAVNRLALIQGPLPTPRPARRVRAPLTPEAERALAAGTAGVGDGDLRAALARLGRAVLAPADPPRDD